MLLLQLPETPSSRTFCLRYLRVILKLFDSWRLVMSLLYVTSLDLSVCTCCRCAGGRETSSSCEGGVGAGSRGSGGRLLLLLFLLSL